MSFLTNILIRCHNLLLKKQCSMSSFLCYLNYPYVLIVIWFKLCPLIVTNVMSFTNLTQYLNHFTQKKCIFNEHIYYRRWIRKKLRFWHVLMHEIATSYQKVCGLLLLLWVKQWTEYYLQCLLNLLSGWCIYLAALYGSQWRTLPPPTWPTEYWARSDRRTSRPQRCCTRQTPHPISVRCQSSSSLSTSTGTLSKIVPRVKGQ